MSKITRNIVILVGAGVLILLGVVLVSISRPSSETAPTETVADPQSVLTAAAQTASFRLTQIAAYTPTPAPATVTFTPTTTNTVTPTTPVPTGPVTTNLPPPSAGDKADFVADVTVPDGTNFNPNQQFVKTWRLLNSGTTTWTTAFKLTFANGTQMGGPSSVALTTTVPPGQSVDISVPMVAPSTAGTYTGFWKMANAANQPFDIPVYVQIIVTGTAPTPTGTVSATRTATTGATSAPSATATTAPAQVSSVVLTVDQPSVTGACPHTFIFTAQLTLSGAATVTYQLESEATPPISLPSPATSPLNAGVNVITFQIPMSESASGWVQLRVSAPNNVISNQVNFTLTCQ